MDGCDLPKRRDPAIKLFGRKIPLPESHIPIKPLSSEITDAVKRQDICSGLSNPNDEHKVSGESNGEIVNYKSKEEESETDGTEHEKAFKKPDKIVPCPRCNSFDTKFCYFNNYNVNQPRHFCKNCQRYWTAGGTMRNVPVGAGRRKNKQFASQYRHLLVSTDGNPVSAKIETMDSVNDHIASPTENGMVLRFGSEPPVCESIDTMLQLGDQKNVSAGLRTVSIGKHETELSASQSSALATSSSCSNDVTGNVLTEEQAVPPRNFDGVTPHGSVPFYPVPPWCFPLNTGWSGGNMNHVQFCPAPMLAVPGGGFLPNMPFHFVPSSYFPCPPALQDPSFSVSKGNISSPLRSTSCGLGNSGSPTLGKHPREPSSGVEELHVGKYVLVPKTPRLDETTEAATKCPV